VGTSAATAGTVFGSVFIAPDNRTVTNLVGYVTAGTSGVTLHKFGLYKKTGASEWTLVGSTDSFHTTTAAGARDIAMTSSVTLDAGETYAIANLNVGSTVTMARAQLEVISAGFGDNRTAWTKAVQTDLPATITTFSTLTTPIYGLAVK
jgi:hypothetical protein